jgi:AcrR family transcriptional regulator
MTVPPPKQKRSQQTLEKIISACDVLLKKATFAETSMQTIATQAGVSVGNLYNRFANKESLIAHLIERMHARYFDSLLRNLQTQPDGRNLAERLQYLATVIEEGLKENSHLLKAVAARNLAGKSPQTEVTDQQGHQIIDILATWLFQSGEEVTHPDGKEACRFAASAVIFGLQYRLIFDTPDRLFGVRQYEDRVVEMALTYLTHPGTTNQKPAG